MKVIAKEMAFYRGARVRPGKVLDLPAGSHVHPWMEVLKEGAPLPSPPKDEGPTPIAPSEMRKHKTELPVGVATASRGVRKKKGPADKAEGADE